MTRITIAIASAMLLTSVGCGDDDVTPGVDAGPGGGFDAGPGTDEDAGPGTDEDAGPGGDEDAGPGDDDAGPGEGSDFTLELRGYAPHLTQDYVVKLFAGDTEVGMATGTVEDRMFEVVIAGVVEDGVEYTVRWYMDVNGNGSCDDAPVDHTWEDTGTGTADGLTITHNHDIEFDDVCGSF